jgi:hypothetical protein
MRVNTSESEQSSTDKVNLSVHGIHTTTDGRLDGYKSKSTDKRSEPWVTSKVESYSVNQLRNQEELSSLLQRVKTTLLLYGNVYVTAPTYLDGSLLLSASPTALEEHLKTSARTLNLSMDSIGLFYASIRTTKDDVRLRRFVQSLLAKPSW